MADETLKAAVYIAFSSFKNSIDQLSNGVPNVIDRSVFPGMSGGVQNQLFAGMRFLGLIDDKSVPLPALLELAVPDEAARKTQLKEILQRSYAQLFALDLMKSTPAQLLEKMRTAYGVSGDTAEKAMRFFLSACQYVGIPISPLFKMDKPSNGGSAGGARRKGRKPKQKAETVTTVDSSGGGGGTGTGGGGESRSVTLRSGGTLTISASAGFLSLSSGDRNFVFGLIDKLEEYEAAATK
jgi:hypothetical protein